MGAKLKFKTHLQNKFFDFFSRFLHVWLQTFQKVLIWPQKKLKKLLKNSQKISYSISKTSLTIMSKSEKSTYFCHIFANTFFWFIFSKLYQQIRNQREILGFLIPILNFWRKIFFALIRQPSKGLHNQVVKIVVSYFEGQTLTHPQLEYSWSEYDIYCSKLTLLSILVALSKILLGHSNSGMLRVTIIRKVVVYVHVLSSWEGRTTFAVSPLSFPPLWFGPCKSVYFQSVLKYLRVCAYFSKFFYGFCLSFIHEYSCLRKTSNMFTCKIE